MRLALDRFGLPLVFVLLCLILSLSSEYFMTWRNWMDILRQTSINGILAIGMTYVVITRGIDLSVGSILAFAGLCSAMVAAQDHGLLASLSAGMFAGAALGAVNGFMVANLSIPPFVATLGMLSIARGMTFILNDGSPITELPESYLALGIGSLGPVSMPIVIFAIVALFFALVLKYTTYGRYVYAVGGNEKSARTSGIGVRKVMFSVYIVSGVLAGLAGMVLTARTTAALPQAGMSYELDAIAAVVIGGTSLSGGSGNIVGTLFGALLIGVINNGLNLLGVSSYYQQVAKGLIIVIAVLVDVWRKKKR
ncbi:inner-membrane translocator [Azotobacter vinelandii CA]|uniref:Bacterial inner-membrane translocator protein n=2 Tax=Azotobacter vinelandii TaxID=354 RepID=C1DG89_AZOVD|nr:Bacterial inner-membrane translocator protein [Azotobacter vinelandii DJ]AGK16740.1 inner-membrane translocator [Azotobacter vinelandii CA]AGK20478.1 inner-membrane translocator [Azotobacter vinelandii CA6]